MWVKNISSISQTLRKHEKIVVLKPGCVADVDLPANANLKKMGLAVLELSEPKPIIGGTPVVISKVSATGKRKTGRRNENR